jgi:hypothetical protein
MGWLAASGSMLSFAEPRHFGGESLDCRVVVAGAIMAA